MADDREYPEGHDTLLEKTECPRCHRPKTLAVYADGHKTCYGADCKYWEPPTGDGGAAEVVAFPKTPKSSALLEPDWQAPANREALAKRKLNLDTLRKYGVFTAGYKGSPVQVYPYFDPNTGEEVAQKLRMADKSFPVLKAEGYTGLQKCALFGWQVYGDRFDRQVVITEGELDALSVGQSVDFKIACVSINTGAGNAAESIKANYLWLDRFQEVILWFDNDDTGKQAAEVCAKLFKVGKVRIATATGMLKGADGKETPCKDASDMLQANRPGDVKAAVYAARAWRPAGIVNAKDTPADVHVTRGQLQSFKYPPCMPVLQAMTQGMWPGEVVYHVAGTGVGKSAVLSEIEYHLLEQGIKVAAFHFEDTRADAKLRLMSIRAGERLHLSCPIPDLPEDEGDAEAMAAYNAACDKRDAVMGQWHDLVFSGGLLELFDPETADWKLEALLGYIRYVAVALGCKLVVIDPMSFVAAGIELTADERRVLDKVAAELAKLAKELGIHIQVSHHLKRVGQGVPHEEGAPTSLNEVRSSGALANFASAVIGWERNNQAPDESWRVTRSRLIKTVRRTGKSGLADTLFYGEDGRLVRSHLPFPPIGKPEEGAASGENSRDRPFGEATRDY